MSGQSADELISKFEQDLKSATAKSSAKYFLMSVDSVKESRTDRDQLLVTGVRIDTGQTVAVVTKKSEGGQYIPEVGGVMRADKVALMQSADMSVARYSAQYFHAYGVNDRCLHAVVQCRPPYQDTEQKWNANVQVLDHEGPSVHIRTVEEFDKFVLALLRPWAWKNPGKCTHDVMGNPLWDQEGARGISPMVHIKMMGGEKVLTQIYGKACVSTPDGQTRLPTVAESKTVLEKSASFQKVRAMFDHEAVKALGLVLVPGVSVGVGRASIAHGQERYLRNPDGWDWTHDSEGQDAEKLYSVTRGYRSGMIHLKKSDKGAWVVVDANPSALTRLSAWGPKSTVEIEYDRGGPLAIQAQSQEQALKQPSKPAPAPAPRPSPQSVETPKPTVTESDSDVAKYGTDLVHTGVESIHAGANDAQPSASNALEDIFAEAEQLAKTRRGIPQFRM